MQNLKESLQTELRIPDINGDRCVHAHIEQASCQSCVTACPENAWILDDESLSLNTHACDGCGLCVPACTEGAISQTQDCTIRKENQQKVLLLGCERTGLEEANCQCIHAVSIHDLLKLYRDGVHQIKVTVSDCHECSRGKNESLYVRVSHINKMLRHRHLLPLHYNELPTREWQHLWKTHEKTAPGVDMNRRMFFRKALSQTLDIVLQQSTFDGFGSGSEVFTPPGKILPLLDNNDSALAEQIYPAVPVFTVSQCTGCHACIKTCPHQALELHLEQDKSFYQVNPSACTGCQLCVDICETNAIQVSRWTRLSNKEIILISRACHSCGVVFYSPQSLVQSLAQSLAPLPASSLSSLTPTTTIPEASSIAIKTNTKNKNDDRQKSLAGDNEETNGDNKGDSKEKPLCTICQQINHQRNLYQVF